MFEEEMKKIRITINTAQTILAKHAAKALVRESPVRTGEYLNSHEIHIMAAPSYGRNPISSEPIPPKMSAANALKLKFAKRNEMIAEINSKTDFLAPIKTLHFVNSAAHAALVEFVGWENTDAYHTYMKAGESVRLRKKELLSRL